MRYVEPVGQGLRHGSRIRLAAIFAALIAVAAMCAAAPAAEAKKKKKATNAPAWFPFAPYVDVSAFPPPDLTAIKAGSGINAVSLGFVTAQGGNQCIPTWGGYTDYPAFGGNPYRKANIDAFRAAGGKIVVSFGGAAGTELASACPTVGALAAAYKQVIAAYRPTHIDFDIEGDEVDDAAGNARRAAAIRILQKPKKKKKKGKKGAATTKKKKKSKPGVAVGFTLAVLPSGLDDQGLGLVRQAVSSRDNLSVVNGMAMDYGPGAVPNPEGQMGELAIQVANSLYGQLKGVYPKLPAAQVWKKVGVTPMIGINDVPTEKFYVEDAQQLASFARSQRIGMLGMWQLNRDKQCPMPTVTTQEDCSGVAQAPYDFSRTLGSFGG